MTTKKLENILKFLLTCAVFIPALAAFGLAIASTIFGIYLTIKDGMVGVIFAIPCFIFAIYALGIANTIMLSTLRIVHDIDGE